MGLLLHRQGLLQSTPAAGGDPLAPYEANSIAPGTVIDPENTTPFYWDGASTTFSGLVTATRSTTGTFTDNVGVIDEAAINVARVAHYLSDGAGGFNLAGLLHEGASTNLVTESEDFTGSPYGGHTNTGTLALDATGPNGVANSSMTLRDSNAGGTGPVRFHYIQILPASGAYTFSVHGKADGVDHMIMHEQLYDTGTNRSYFDLTNGVPGTLNPDHIGSVALMGNSWRRNAVQFSTAIDLSGTVLFSAATTDNSNINDLDGTTSIQLFGSQIEAGVLSSYIPTSGSSAARGADFNKIAVADMNAAILADTASASMPTAVSGSLHGFVSFEATSPDSTLYDWNDDVNNRITVTLDASTGKFTLTMVNGGSSETVTTTAALTAGNDVAFKIAWYADAGGINIALNGTDETETATSPGVPDLTVAGADCLYGSVVERIIISEALNWFTNIETTGIEENTA